MATATTSADEAASVLKGRATAFPLWHAAVLLGMLAMLLGLSTMHSAAGRVSQRLAGYFVIAAFEWVMVIWIALGCRIQGGSIYELLGDFAIRWRAVLRDIS